MSYKLTLGDQRKLKGSLTYKTIIFQLYTSSKSKRLYSRIMQDRLIQFGQEGTESVCVQGSPPPQYRTPCTARDRLSLRCGRP